MHPVSLEAKDFLSFEHGVHEFQEGLVLIEGENDDKSGSSNGSGKSCFFSDLLPWILFGRTFRGSRYDEVIRKGCKYTMGKAELIHNDEKIIIQRERKLGQADLVSVNNKRIRAEFIPEIIGIDYPTFTSAVIRGQNSEGFAERMESEQKEILTRLMGLEVWDTYKKTALASIQAVKGQLQTLRWDEESLFKRKLEIERMDYTELTQQFEAEKANRINKLAKFKAEKSEESKTILEQLKEKQTFTVTDNSNLIREVEQLIEKKENQIADLKGALGTAKGRLRDEQENANYLTQKIEEYENLSGTCMVCKQKITLKSKNACIQEVTEVLKKSYENSEFLQAKIKAVTDSLEVQIKELLLYKTNFKGLKEHQAEQRETLLKISHLKDLKKKTDQRIEELELEIELAKATKNPYNSLIKQRDSDLQAITDEIKKVQLDLQQVEKDFKYYDFWDEGFGNQGIKSFIFDALIPELTMKANKYLQTLTDKNIFITFDTQREKKTGGFSEKFSIKIEDDAGERPFYAWSGGEKKRLSVAVDLALADMLLLRSKTVWDFLCFDECMESMDEQGAEMMLYLMQEVVRERSRVYIISHDSTLKGMIDRRVLVKKKDGISYFE